MIEVAAAAARAGGGVLRDALGARRDLNWKTDEAGERSLVTDADLQADAAIQAVIRAAAPDHAILSEEGAQPPDPAGHLWVIDPLDGTDEFARGSPSCCVAVAYAHGGLTQAAAVYDAFRDELFTAERGRGARLNGRPIAVAPTDDLARAVVAASSPDRTRSEAAFSQTCAVIEALFERTHRVRIYGSTALEICWIAAGRLDGKVSLRGRVWDFLAAALVLEEAGGRCTSIDGGPIALDIIGAVASNGRLHEEMSEIVRRCLAGESPPRRVTVRS